MAGGEDAEGRPLYRLMSGCRACKTDHSICFSFERK